MPEIILTTGGAGLSTAISCTVGTAIMAKGASIPPCGNGLNIRDWLYVEDHCAALETVIRKGVAGEPYCVGGDNERTNQSLIDMPCDLVDQSLGRPQDTSRKLKIFVQVRTGHDRLYAIDATTQAQMELGWKPETTFQSGLKQTVAWPLDIGGDPNGH